MLRISKLTDYAILIVTDVAKQPDCCTNAAGIVARTELGMATVKKILRKLMKAELLASAQGVGGGYTLTKPTDEITIANIVTIMEGNVAITQCSDNHQDCDKIANCHVSKNWQFINKIIMTALDSISIKEMLMSHVEWQPVVFKELDNHLSRTKHLTDKK